MTSYKRKTLGWWTFFMMAISRLMLSMKVSSLPTCGSTGRQARGQKGGRVLCSCCSPLVLVLPFLFSEACDSHSKPESHPRSRVVILNKIASRLGRAYGSRMQP